MADYKLNGDAAHLLSRLRGSPDPGVIVDVARQLDNMVRAGLPPEVLRRGLGQAASHLALSYSSDYNRTVVRPRHAIATRASEAKQGGAIESDAEAIVAMVRSIGNKVATTDKRLAPYYSGNKDKSVPPEALVAELNATRLPDERLGIMLRCASAADVVLFASAHSGRWDLADGAVGHARPDRLRSLLAREKLVADSSTEEPTISTLRLDAGDSERALLVIYTPMLRAVAEDARLYRHQGSVAVAARREVSVGLTDYFSVDLPTLRGLAPNLSMGSNGAFEITDEVDLALSIMCDESRRAERGPISPLASVVTAKQEFGKPQK